MFVCLPVELILGFCYSDLTLETDRFELASTITIVLQANCIASVTKCEPTNQLIFQTILQKQYFL